jgi:hypothetical protein
MNRDKERTKTRLRALQIAVVPILGISLFLFPPAAAATGSGDTCFEGTSHPDVTARINWRIDDDQTATIRVTFSKSFVDNTYGANAIGWGDHGHKFNNLVGSDHVILALYNGDGQESLEPKVDYISADASVPSGYRTLGVSGGDGRMNLGSASDVVAVETSLSKNFNTYGYVLTQDSPATDANYSANPAYPNWIYDVWYQVTVKSSAFGPSGFGHATLNWVHASPSKTGSNTEDVSSSPCPPPTPAPCPQGQMRDQSGNCGPPPCGEGQMPGENGTCAPPPTSTSQPPTTSVPVFPTAWSLALGTLGAVGGALLVLRRRKGTA